MLSATLRNFKEGVHYDRSIERAVLGICLLELNPVPHILRALRPEHFYDDGHQFVFKVFKEMYDKGAPLTVLHVWQYLADKKNTTKIGTYESAYFLSRLTNDVVSSVHTSYNVNVILELHYRREIFAAQIEGRPILHTKETVKKLTRWKMPPHARWYLGIITKEVLRFTGNKYGCEYIQGNPGIVNILVPNIDWVYILHLVAPEYTWTCNSLNYNKELSVKECNELLPVDKKLYLENGRDLIWR